MNDGHDGSTIDLERALVRYMAERRVSRRQLLERMAAVGTTVALAPVIAACSSSATPSPSAAASLAPSPSAAASGAAASPSPAPSTEPSPSPTPEDKLNIYNWDAYIGEDTVQAFQAKYRIAVTYDKFPDEATQLAKIRSDGKGGGYDITYPASTNIPSLISEGVIQPLDLALIPNAKNVGTEWQNPGYDPGNANSMPYMWWTTGYAWDGDKIKDELTDWTALWDERFKGHLGMLDDLRETFAVAAFRLGHDPNTTNDVDLDAELALLEQQKPLVRIYTSDDIGDLTSGQLWITHAWSGDYYQMLADKPNTKYVVPASGRDPRLGHDGRAVGGAAPGRREPVDRLQPRCPGQRVELELHRLHGPERRGPAVHRPDDPRRPDHQPGEGDTGPARRAARPRHRPRQVHPALEPAEGLVATTTAGSEAVPATTARPRRRPLTERLAGPVLIAPGVIWLGLFFLVPLVIIFVVSLGTKDATGHVSLAAPDLHNYAEATRAEYIPAFANSLRYALITTIFSILIGYPIAYWISRYGGRHKVLLLILVMLPFWTSYLIRTYAWMIILRDNGVLNALLSAVGIISDPIPFLNTDFSVVLGMVYGFLPFAILPLYVSIDRLDGNLVAAARDLYASGRQAFLHVTLPLTMPGIIAAALLTFIPSIGDYVTPDLLGGAQTTTIAKVVQVVFTSGRDWPYGSALGFLLMLVTLAGTLVALRWVRRETLGG